MMPETQPESPLMQMTTDERLSADYYGTGLTVGRHPMHFQRNRMNAWGVTPKNVVRNSSPGVTAMPSGTTATEPPPPSFGAMFDANTEMTPGSAWCRISGRGAIIRG